MKHINKLLKNVSLVALLLLVGISSINAQLPHKLDSLSKISGTPKLSGIKKLDVSDKMENAFKEKYVLFVEQPIDHNDLSKGTYNQRVVVMVADYNAPTVMITEGYGGAYALNPRYREEISKLFNTNIVFVEHRYFMESIPFKQQDSTITDETLD